MSFSDYLENKILAYTFSGTAFTPAATKYMALYTVAPNDDGTGGTEVSTSGTGYARQTVAFTTTSSQSSNSAAVEFATSQSSWGTVTAIGVLDAATSGNLYAVGTLAVAKPISTGDVFRVPAGDLDIDLT
jgi:hypothetical protein|tara:strand:+ start:793 stop:1182 length:390 start_codon:yes stop_codon:yes gene_type:complete